MLNEKFELDSELEADRPPEVALWCDVLRLAVRDHAYLSQVRERYRAKRMTGQYERETITRLKANYIYLKRWFADDCEDTPGSFGWVTAVIFESRAAAMRRAIRRYLKQQRPLPRDSSSQLVNFPSAKNLRKKLLDFQI